MNQPSYDKGLELEKLIAQLFRSKGYDVMHNVKLKGRSGVEHQIDVYAEYKCPLHLSRIIIECKAYDKPINKDIVMKLVQEVLDLGVDRGILATTSYFTPDAVSSANGYNVDLWDYNKLTGLLGGIELSSVEAVGNVFHIEPRLSSEESKRVVEKRVKGLLRKGEVLELVTVFYPYYEFDCDVAITEIKGMLRKKSEVKIVKAKLTVDACINALVSAHGEGVRLILRVPRTISDEESEAFKLLLRLERTTVASLASLLTCSEAKARKILQGLTARGLAKQVKVGRQIQYEAGVYIPHPSALAGISRLYELKNGEPVGEKLLPPSVSVNDAERMLETIWDVKINDYRLVYYPYHIWKTYEEGKEGVVAVDALTGNVNEFVGKLLAKTILFH